MIVAVFSMKRNGFFLSGSAAVAAPAAAAAAVPANHCRRVMSPTVIALPGCRLPGPEHVICTDSIDVDAIGGEGGVKGAFPIKARRSKKIPRGGRLPLRGGCG